MVRGGGTAQTEKQQQSGSAGQEPARLTEDLAIPSSSLEILAEEGSRREVERNRAKEREGRAEQLRAIFRAGPEAGPKLLAFTKLSAGSQEAVKAAWFTYKHCVSMSPEGKTRALEDFLREGSG